MRADELSHFRSIVREFVMPMALRAGMDQVLRRSGGKRLLNVMYHGVVREDSTWFSPRHTTDRAFDEQLTYLRKRFDIVTMADAFEMKASGHAPRRHTITLSFDDGYLNNLEVALPIIEEHRVPVTFFVLGPCAEANSDRVLWPDRIAMLDRVSEREVKVLGGTYVRSVEARRGTQLADDLKAASPDERDDALRQLDRDFGLLDRLNAIDPHVWKLMDPEQLSALASAPLVEIGSHGYAHYNLGLIPIADAVHDMSKSKAALEKLLGKPVESIAYPDGSYTVAVKDAAEALGFKRQLAVGFSGSDDFADRRIQQRHGVSSTTSTASVLLFLNLAFKNKGVL